jgi:fumigallin biosynthesis monooxygenase-like protein
MASRIDRRTVDLSEYPDLVVIYLGMRVRKLAGIKRLFGLGPQIAKAGQARPEGLLHWDNGIVYSLFPLHLGMRWYWKDFESMERWARSEPHRRWWQDFLRDSGGTGFWHETYFMRGGMEAIYDDTKLPPLGFETFAPVVAAHGPMFSARTRLHLMGETPTQPEGTTEPELMK